MLHILLVLWAIFGYASSEKTTTPIPIASTSCVEQQEGDYDEWNSHGETRFCKICKYPLSTRMRLINHYQKLHPEEKLFVCEVCHKMFSSSFSLKSHVLTHTGVRSHRCNVCGESYLLQSLLDAHVKTHHCEKPFPCGICLKSYSTRYHLRRHARIHTNERRVSCGTCEATFKTKIDLEKHMRSHPDERPFPCNLCDRSYKSRSGLRDHEEYHSDEKRVHKCDECKQQFPSRKALCRHGYKHGRDSIFSCELCGKTYKFQSMFERHLETHSEKELFMCKICSKEYKTECDLNEHICENARGETSRNDFNAETHEFTSGILKHALTRIDRESSLTRCHRRFEIGETQRNPHSFGAVESYLQNSPSNSNHQAVYNQRISSDSSSLCSCHQNSQGVIQQSRCIFDELLSCDREVSRSDALEHQAPLNEPERMELNFPNVTPLPDREVNVMHHENYRAEEINRERYELQCLHDEVPRSLIGGSNEISCASADEIQEVDDYIRRIVQLSGERSKCRNENDHQFPR
ncbi:hypothetical protein QAD02_009529 [Eretmocerus hayati]|uniref:Uncharacterized protein n=1 Tax=Eretmocerus hayati TaxID=131215 RepID=A0ACC2N9X0_9HYME|nr:hypothetical protein QAD02_009529 [Eretmocerus hayati]